MGQPQGQHPSQGDQDQMGGKGDEGKQGGAQAFPGQVPHGVHQGEGRDGPQKAQGPGHHIAAHRTPA